MIADDDTILMRPAKCSETSKNILRASTQCAINQSVDIHANATTFNEEGKEFGVDYLTDYFKSNHYKDLKTIHQDLIVALDGFKGRNSYRDDITLLSCRVEQ